MAVEAEAAPDEPVEVPSEEVGQIERPDLLLGKSAANAAEPA